MSDEELALHLKHVGDRERREDPTAYMDYEPDWMAIAKDVRIDAMNFELEDDGEQAE